jgi:hypothetical protein
MGDLRAKLLNVRAPGPTVYVELLNRQQRSNLF